MNQADKLRDARQVIEQVAVDILQEKYGDAYSRSCHAARLLRELEARETINHAIGAKARDVMPPICRALGLEERQRLGHTAPDCIGF